MQSFFARLQEPSTHAALASLSGVATAVAVSQGADPHVVGLAGTVLSALFSLFGIFMGEKAA